MALHAFDLDGFDQDAFDTGYVFSANTGSYAVSGNAVAMQYVRSSHAFDTDAFDEAFDNGEALYVTSENYPLTGNPSATAKGFKLFGDTGAYPYNGNVATATISMPADKGEYLYAGNNVDFGYAYRLPLHDGVYTYTPYFVEMQKSGSPILYAFGDNYTYTGRSAAFQVHYVGAIEHGQFPVAGSAVGFNKTSLLPPAIGAYAYTGHAASAQFGMHLDTGVYVQTRFEATREIKRNPLLPGHFDYTTYGVQFVLTWTPETLVYTQTRYPVDLIKHKVLAAAKGTYVQDGNSTILRPTRKLGVDTGEYLIAGSEIAFTAVRAMEVDTGDYPFVGYEDALTVGRTALVPDTGNYPYAGKNVRLIETDLFSFDDNNLLQVPAEDRTITVAA